MAQTSATSRRAVVATTLLLVGATFSMAIASATGDDCDVDECMTVVGKRITCEDGAICSDGRPQFDSLDCFLSLTALENARMTGAYGEPRGNGLHRGVDLGVPNGTEVCAAKDGVVREFRTGLPVGDRSTLNGNYIRISYDDGTEGVYLHLKFVAESVQGEGRGG